MASPVLPPPPTAPVLRLVPIVLGFFGLAVSLAFAALAGHFLPWHFAMGGLSIATLLGGLAWLAETRWQAALASLVYSLFFALCLALLYLISANRDVRLDLTRDGVHTLSPQTRSVLRALPVGQRVAVTLFAGARSSRAYDRFLSAYSRESGAFSYELADPARDLDLVAAYGGNIEEGRFFVSLIDGTGAILRRQDSAIPPDNMLNRESILTNTLARLTAETQQVIYYSTGFGERRLDGTEPSLTKAMEIVEKSTLPVRPLRLMEGRIPDDAAAILVAGPALDLDEFSRELLIGYLREGGRLLVMMDPKLREERNLDNLEAVLASIGIRSPNRLIVDPVAINSSGSPFTPLTQYTNHPIAGATSKVPFLLDRARPIETTNPIPDGVVLDGVIVTGERIWSESADAPRSIRRIVPPTDQSEFGVLVLGAAAQKNTPGARHGDEMRAVILGDSDAFANRNLEANGDAGVFLVACVNWLRARPELLQIPPRLMASTPITLTQQRLTLIGTGLLLAGLLVLVGGTTATLIRRRIK